MKEVLLYSGGLDSYLAREYLLNKGHNELECVYYDLKHRYSKQEIETLKKLPFNVSVDSMLKLGIMEQPDAYIPNRNLFLTMAAASTYADTIWIGGTMSDRVVDNKKDVFDKFSAFLSEVNQKHIKIDSPFWDCYKTDAMRWFRIYRSPSFSNADLKPIANELLNNTFSCFTPSKGGKVTCSIQDVNEKEDTYFRYNTTECMKCAACFRKSVELNSVGICRPFMDDNIIEKYRTEFSYPLVSTPRAVATIKYIQKLDYIKHKIKEIQSAT